MARIENMAPAEWFGFDILGRTEWVDAAEALIPALWEDGILLGTSREDKLAGVTSAAEVSVRQDSTLRVYLAPTANINHCAQEIRNALQSSLPAAWAAAEVRVVPFALPNEDWATTWREFYRPIRISERLIILPAWWDGAAGYRDTQTDPAQARVVRIEPGRAFGSGNHATTQLALHFLEERLVPGHRVLDFGAGSGILSFAAAALGAGPIVDIEIDGECEDNFCDNIRINRFEGRIEYRVGSSEMLKPEERFEVVLCNILFQNAEPHLTKIARHLADKGCLILSGYLTEETGAVRRRIEGAGLQVASHSEEEEWGALVAQKQ